MADRAERARWMLNFPGVLKKEAAAAMGVDASAVSRLLRSERRISEEEFDRLQEYFRNFRGDGFEEPFAPDVTPAPTLSPIYPARAVDGGDWTVDLAASPEQQMLAPTPFRGIVEVFGFRAPDAGAWPRFKLGEIVWVSPTAIILPGDDVFETAIETNAGAARGRLAEFRRLKDGSEALFDFASGQVRSAGDVRNRLQKIAPRDF